MRILVLGGTEFVGHALVETALAQGHDVTTLNRGNHAKAAKVTSLQGDRTKPEGLRALEGQNWDVVLDTWSWDSYVVTDSVKALRESARSYVFISTRSVYQFPTAEGADEGAPLVEGDPEAGRDGAEVPYGEAKRGSEIAVEQGFPESYLHVRAGLILGPRENIGRLPWWLNRIKRGGDVLAPGPQDLPLQYVDARDLAAWTISAVERGLSGPYDMVSRSGHTTMGEFLSTCVEVTGSADARLRWSDPQAVVEAGFAPWSELPVWIPPGPDHAGLHLSDTSKVLAAGLQCRPVQETIADTWAWLQSIGGEVQLRPDRPRPGIGPDREAAFLKPNAE
ncbi:NAD-dependent epimerase/dehydratase family protein [Kineosporia babensis]|uniref:NAD-dependent epimerase/dehydratase family protein n=1 Tax=Kineosporia babensis TaxID=499548 RepID=A0A9X1N9F3_9ACTN|nr:NAD-dependent epimerase/dehydratase family protein [Kineosporia babensis]MCD5309646.1 NAD-dependent epimerase/dehydratase family protein [Kineosporia babensis]